MDRSLLNGRILLAGQTPERGPGFLHQVALGSGRHIVSLEKLFVVPARTAPRALCLLDPGLLEVGQAGEELAAAR
jgi:hypothetical protein